MKESGYLLANGKSIDAYSDIKNPETTKTGTFYNGRLQIEVQSKQKDVVLNPLEVSDANNNLNIATSYTPKEGFISSCFAICVVSALAFKR